MPDLMKEYDLRKKDIRSRLEDFKRFYSDNVSWFYSDRQMCLKEVETDFDQRMFEELCFCILTANGSAKSAMKAIDHTRDVLMTGSAGSIQKKLKDSGIRFHNRAFYIVFNREKLKTEFGFDFKKIFSNRDNVAELRDFFVKNIKGLGYKEASHFLRNIGFSGVAILDKHILRSMKEFGLIDEVPETMNKKKYNEIEAKLVEFSKQIEINIDELDLLLWSMKNGQIMK